MTADRYFMMCEQLGIEPKEEDVPVDWYDLPDIAQQAINIYNRLGDRVVSDLGFIGKDYTNLQVVFDILEIEDKETTLEIIQDLEAKQIKKSSEQLKKMHDKMKRKSKGNVKGHP
jgi:hypothetical protein